MIALDPLLLDDRVKADVQVQRYRADYLMRDLWRLYHGRVQWSVLVRHAGSMDGRGAAVAGAGSLRSMRAAYRDVIVPAHARLGVEEHVLRVWRGALRQARHTLQRDEELAVEDYLLADRHASVFRVDGAYVRRSATSSEHLARAALKLASAGETKPLEQRAEREA